MGLEMHVGRGETKSKTEAMYFPTNAFFKQPAPTTITDSPDSSNLSTINPAEDTSEHYGAKTYSKLTQNQREAMYHASPNTDRVYMQDETSYIDFTPHFKYLGTYISFDLSADFDINNRITKASREMGRLRHFFNNQYVELNFKHQVFLQYIVNILLWGCESWAIKDYHFKQLNSFIHRSIRRILHIRMSQVIDDHIKNSSIRKTFFNLPTAEDLVTIRAMTYLGKLTRGPMSNPAKQLLAAFVNHPRAIGGIIMTNKKAMVKYLNILLPSILHMETTTTDPITGANTTRTRPNKDRDFHLWHNIAMDEDKWEEYINKLRHPGIEDPPRQHRRKRRRHSPNNHDEDDADQPENNDEQQQPENHDEPPPPQQPQPPPNPPPPPPPPSPQHHQRGNQGHQNRGHNRHRNGTHHQPNTPQQHEETTEPSKNHTNTNYNRENVGRTLLDSLKAMGLNLTATTREVRTQFRILSMIYHPDKYSPATLDISPLEAQAHFQLINNAHAYLRTCNL
jgi:hypothetical protein